MKRSDKTLSINPMDHITRGDLLLGVAVVATALVLFVFMPGWVLSGGTRLEIRAGREVVGAYSLNEDRLITVRGPLGVTAVRIEKGRARIESSPCPEGICVHSGDIGSEGGVIVCVPNEVAVSVANDRSDGLDAVTR